METITEFAPSSRYEYDHKHCSSKKGYAQLDTSEDAHYFSNWINPFTLTVVTYCEGDVSISTADNVQELLELLNKFEEFHEKISIDPGFNEELKNKLIEIGLKKYLH